MPTGASVYFQALDDNGLAVQSMRSATYLHPGETMSCVGCHESKTTRRDRRRRAHGPWPAAVDARSRAAGLLSPDIPARLVQPVLDTKCVKCHEDSPKAGAARRPVRRERLVRGIPEPSTLAWATLDSRRMRGGWLISIPGPGRARVSKLYGLLSKRTISRVDEREIRRITLWLDCGQLLPRLPRRRGPGPGRNRQAQARNARVGDSESLVR